MGYTKEDYINYKGKGEHSVNELEKIIEQREELIHLIKTTKPVNVDLAVVSGSLSSLQEWAKLKKDNQIEEIIVRTAFGNTIVVDLTSKSSIDEFCDFK